MTKRKSLLFTFFGTMLTGFAIGVFLTPNKIVGGGVSGIATVLYHKFSVQPGITIFLSNILLLITGLKILGKNFTLKTLFGATLLSLFTQLFSYIPFYTENTLIACVFGGGIYGMGIGISFAAGASTGGTDIIGRLVQHKFKTVPIGRLLLAVDGIIILVSLAVFKNFELTLFGILTLFISSYTIDYIIGSFNISRLAFVITEKGDEIAKKLVTSYIRGVTVIDVVGAYTGDKKKMLFCALKESESDIFQRRILDIDEKAFIVFAESQRIKGKGFYLYK